MTEAFVVLGGGLGNQLFSAAFCIAIERHFGVQTKLLATRKDWGDPFGRRYLLRRFPLLDQRRTEPSAAEGAPVQNEQGVDQATLEALFAAQPRVALHGYWQNERYFFGENEAISAALQIEADAALTGRAVALGASDSIGVHIRRTEYGQQGLATADYYYRSIEAIRAEVGEVPVLVFADEPHFARVIFRDVSGVTVLDPDRDDPVDDFWLFTQCRHFVIANSSFSWWAAWLGEAPGSIVYAPLPWVAFAAQENPVPARWRAIENAVRGP